MSSRHHIDILFIHIHKTGGKSISEILHRIYKESYFRMNRNIIRDGNISSIRDLAAQIPDSTKVLAGHLQYEEIEPIISESTRIITWLRDPIQRVISNYHWRRKLNIEQPNNNYPLNSPDISLLEFASLERNQNRITKFLSGLTPADLYFIGFLETFDQDIAQLSSRLNWPNVPSLHINQNIHKPANFNVSQDILDKITILNRRDIEFYNLARSLRN